MRSGQGSLSRRPGWHRGDPGRARGAVVLVSLAEPGATRCQRGRLERLECQGAQGTGGNREPRGFPLPVPPRAAPLHRRHAPWPSPPAGPAGLSDDTKPIGPLCGWQRQRQPRACAPAALSQRVAPAKARKAAEVAVVRMHHRLVVDRQGGDVRIGEQGALEHAGFREAR